MRPGDDQNQHLQVAVRGNADEIEPQQVSVVAGVGMEEDVGDSRADDMAREQDRNGKSEDDLAKLGRAQPQASPLPQRPQGKPRMDDKAAVEQHLPRAGSPDPETEP